MVILPTYSGVSVPPLTGGIKAISSPIRGLKLSSTYSWLTAKPTEL